MRWRFTYSQQMQKFDTKYSNVQFFLTARLKATTIDSYKSWGKSYKHTLLNTLGPGFHLFSLCLLELSDCFHNITERS